MPRRAADDAQHRLFGDHPRDRALEAVAVGPVDDEERRLAAALPATVRLGTSSWSFPGWRGTVFAPDARAGDLARAGLAAYSSHPLFRTVGLDRAFYSLLAEREAAELAGLVPEGFRFLVKVHQSVTRPDADLRGRTFGDTAALRASGIANPRFLDVAHAVDAVIAPAVRGFGRALGPLLFQFPPLGLPAGSVELRRFVARLAEFLAALPRGPLYAVEFRDRSLFADARALADLATALIGSDVVLGLAHHPALPTIDRQLESLGQAGWRPALAPAVVVRWLLGHGLGHAEARGRYSPFDRVVEEDLATRATIATLLRSALPGRLAWVIANNKAEGSAPVSLRRLAIAATD